MPKPKLREFKRYLAELDEPGLRAELLKLFGKLPQVQEFYAQELASPAERKTMLNDYKKKIENQFWTHGGNPKNNIKNVEIRRILSDFEQVAVSPHELIDLMLYRVEVATSFANTLGGMPEAAYKAALAAFQKAVKLMGEHRLLDYFKSRCEDLFQYGNVDYWYIEWLEEAWREQYGYPE
jgi:Family of unknown function (DUF6155)